MKYAILLTILLSGCSTTFHERTQDAFQLDAIYCDGKGFVAYSELNGKSIFICKGGGRFMIDPRD